MGEKRVAGDLPGGGDVIVNSVSPLTMETWENCDCQYFTRVIRSSLAQVEVHSLTTTYATGDVANDQQFGHDCELTDNEWSLFCGCFFRNPTITRDEAGVGTAL